LDAVDGLKILIIGGGIGGLTAAIALGRDGHGLTIVEKDPDWAVYGVGIIQQANVVRAMAELGVIDDYLEAGFGFDEVEVYLPNGLRAARIPTPRLVPGLPSNVGIARRRLHEVLGARAKAAGAEVSLGITVESFAQDADGVNVIFSDGSNARYDLVIGADGLFSRTRVQLLGAEPSPKFTGQSVWRYNFSRTPDVDCLQAYDGAVGVGLVPLAHDLMYMYVTTPEPGNPRYPTAGLAQAMRAKLTGMPAAIAALADQIRNDDDVVYKPLETLFVDGPWHDGRVVLIGDAVHATTPHLGQGAGMAIEDALVVAEEIRRHETPMSAFAAFQARRFDRCKYIVEASLAICRSQLGEGPHVEQAKATAEMFGVVAQPI
jgi:2-polyprenyl-6-methoxyphenol hydroxylase-like FAD-dependent oxidoreductase